MKDVTSVLSGGSLTFTKFSWKSFGVIYGAVLSVGFAIGLLAIPVLRNDYKMWFLLAAFFFFMVGVWSFLTKIVIDSDGITSKSWLNTWHYSWKDIQTKGVFISGNRFNVSEVILSDRYNDFFLCGINLFFFPEYLHLLRLVSL